MLSSSSPNFRTSTIESAVFASCSEDSATTNPIKCASCVSPIFLSIGDRSFADKARLPPFRYAIAVCFIPRKCDRSGTLVVALKRYYKLELTLLDDTRMTLEIAHWLKSTA
jgi:hypothetical protein